MGVHSWTLEWWPLQGTAARAGTSWACVGSEGQAGWGLSQGLTSASSPCPHRAANGCSIPTASRPPAHLFCISLAFVYFKERGEQEGSVC